MKFKALQDNLRKTLNQRIGSRQLTGLKLAQQTGFRQAHISNFLNAKRALSLEGMDKVLKVQHLSVLDLLDPDEINKRASIGPPQDGRFENVLLVSSCDAASKAVITSDMVVDILKFKRNFLKRLRVNMASKREHWRRFVLMKVSETEARSMYPRVMGGSTVLIDRHYNSLEPYRRGENNMYAIKRQGRCNLRYVEESGEFLLLRPHNPVFPIDLLEIEHGKSACDYIVGRICQVGNET